MASISEQQICVECGFCCDGTLFSNAILEPGERGNLPTKIESAYFSKNDREFFKLPCRYFDTRCTIYNKKKASICSSFRCQLLKNFENGRHSKAEAIKIIHQAISMRNEIFQTYQTITGSKQSIFFRDLIKELSNIVDDARRNGFDDQVYEVFLARCNIFESLLIKYFRSEKDFENMIASE